MPTDSFTWHTTAIWYKKSKFLGRSSLKSNLFDCTYSEGRSQRPSSNSSARKFGCHLHHYNNIINVITLSVTDTHARAHARFSPEVFFHGLCGQLAGSQRHSPSPLKSPNTFWFITSHHGVMQWENVHAKSKVTLAGLIGVPIYQLASSHRHSNWFGCWQQVWAKQLTEFIAYLGVEGWVVVIVSRIKVILLHGQMHIFHFSSPKWDGVAKYKEQTIFLAKKRGANGSAPSSSTGFNKRQLLSKTSHYRHPQVLYFPSFHVPVNETK